MIGAAFHRSENPSWPHAIPGRKVGPLEKRRGNERRDGDDTFRGARLFEPVRGAGPRGVRGLGVDVSVLRAVQRGTALLRRGAGLVPRRYALPRADVPVRLRHRRLAVHVPRPGEHADLRGASRPRDRSSSAVRVGVHERQRGHRRGRDRAQGAAVRRARRLLLPELGRPLRPLAGKSGRHDRRTRGARGARSARDRGQRGRHRGPRDRLGAHAAGRVRPAAREHRPHLAVPLRVSEPRLRGVPRVLRAVQAELPRHPRSDDREDGERHRCRPVPARQRARPARGQGGRAGHRRRREGGRQRNRPSRRPVDERARPGVAGRLGGGQDALVLLLERQRLLPPSPLVDRRSKHSAELPRELHPATPGRRRPDPTAGRGERRARAHQHRVPRAA